MTIRFILALAVLSTALLAAGGAMAGILEITGPPGVAVTINDEEVGVLPLDGPIGTRVGEYVVKASHPGYVPFEQTVIFFAEEDVNRITVRLLPLSKKTAWTSSILYAGLGQFYLGHKTRGWIYATAETAGLLTAIYGELDRSNKKSDYLSIQDAYNSEINGDEAARLRDDMDQAYQDMLGAEDLRNTGLIVAVGAITLSVIDALISFPHVESGPGLVPMQTGFREGIDGDPSVASLHAGVRMEF